MTHEELQDWLFQRTLDEKNLLKAVFGYSFNDEEFEADFERSLSKPLFDFLEQRNYSLSHKITWMARHIFGGALGLDDERLAKISDGDIYACLKQSLISLRDGKPSADLRERLRAILSLGSLSEKEAAGYWGKIQQYPVIMTQEYRRPVAALMHLSALEEAALTPRQILDCFRKSIPEVMQGPTEDFLVPEEERAAAAAEAHKIHWERRALIADQQVLKISRDFFLVDELSGFFGGETLYGDDLKKYWNMLLPEFFDEKAGGRSWDKMSPAQRINTLKKWASLGVTTWKADGDLKMGTIREWIIDEKMLPNISLGEVLTQNGFFNKKRDNRTRYGSLGKVLAIGAAGGVVALSCLYYAVSSGVESWQKRRQQAPAVQKAAPVQQPAAARQASPPATAPTPQAAPAAACWCA